jgi:hypothetical protein
MMRPAALLMFAFLLAGCVADGGRPNATNATNGTNVTAEYARFTAPTFTFEYPPDMEVENASYGYNGVFTGRHQLADRTGEILAVVYANTSYSYGENADAQYRVEPTLAVSGFLQKDLLNDSMGFLNRGESVETGNMTSAAIGRDVYLAEVPMTLRFASAVPYSGYALDLYVPERSLIVKVRILALNPALADAIREQFVLSFRVK